MTDKPSNGLRPALIWGALALGVGVPLALAAFSPLIAWRGPTYIIACFAGIFSLVLLLLQPLLIGRLLPLAAPFARRAHLWVGALLLLALGVHIGGLWITSPPDVIDILLLTSPTAFSYWGVIAMWALLATALLAALRRRSGMRPRHWRMAHKLLALVIVIGTVVHALLIEGLMESYSKAAFSALVLAATLRVIVWPGLRAALESRMR